MARIIVVEDSDFLRADLVEEVELWGHQVVGTGNGTHGYEAVKTFHPDIVLSDVNVPGMNGIDLLFSIRKLGGPFSRIPFVFLTGDEGLIASEVGEANVEFLQKPVDYGVLKRTVDAALAQMCEVAMSD